MAAVSSRPGTHVVPTQRVTFEEVLAHLGARSDVPSMIGSQLEGAHGRAIPDGVAHAYAKALRESSREAQEHAHWHTMRAKGDSGIKRDEEARIESRIFNRARVINCVDGLSRYQRLTFIQPGVPDVEKYARESGLAQGLVAVGVLRAYEEWQEFSKERALAAVYEWMRDRGARDAAGAPVLPLPAHDEESVAQAFRVGKAKVCRRRAAMMVGDSMIVLTAWVELWNRRQGRVEAI